MYPDVDIVAPRRNNMFDKKPIPKPETPDQNVSVETIPNAFYGGNDPVIYHEPDVVAAPVIAQVPKPITPISPKPIVSQPVPPKSPVPASAMAHSTGSKKMFIFAGIIIVLLIIGAGAWWFMGNSESQTVVIETIPEPPVFSETEPIESEPVIVETPTSTVEENIQKPTALTSIPLDFPSQLSADTGDQDTDSLTDKEEELLGTDSGISDTDKDGYYDGQEVYNLYNPTGFAPVKIIDSGLVKEYVNPTWQYRLYYPTNWEVGSVDSAANQILISSVAGDYIEVRAIIKTKNETFFDWISRVATQQLVTDLQQTKNRFEEQYWLRKDSLVAYVEQDLVVYVILYHPGIDGSVAYRHMMQMLLQSFRPSKTLISLPDQAVLPTPPPAFDSPTSATSSISAPVSSTSTTTT